MDIAMTGAYLLGQRRSRPWHADDEDRASGWISQIGSRLEEAGVESVDEAVVKLGVPVDVEIIAGNRLGPREMADGRAILALIIEHLAGGVVQHYPLAIGGCRQFQAFQHQRQRRIVLDRP